MADLGATLPGLYELNQLDRPDGDGFLKMIYSMTEMQDILKDMPFFQANDRTSHKYIRESKLASGTWVDFNDGISSSKGGMITDRAEIGMLESRLTVDMRFANFEPDFTAYVERLAHPHYIGLSNDMADAVVNGTTTGGYRFNSIEAHITDTSQTDQFGKSMCHTYGGSTTVTSILAIDWGQDKVYAVYPRGHKNNGVEKHEYDGDQLTTGNNSSEMRSYVCDFMWNMGLVIADDRCVRRICNIEPVGSTYNPQDTNFDTDPIIDAIISMYNMGREAILYMNREVWGHLWKDVKSDATVNYTAQNPWQQPDYMFSGHRVRFSDSLLNSESQVS